MRVWLFSVLVLMLGGASAHAQDASLHTSSIGRIEWTGDQPTSGVAAARAVPFDIAMLQYRQAALASWSAGPYPILDENGAAAGAATVWLAKDGSHVVRVRQGLFRLTTPDAASGWFRSTDCAVLEWPDFACSDGLKRAMSVPSNTRLVFDKVAFERLDPIESEPAERE
jgi:hypothetical protein